MRLSKSDDPHPDSVGVRLGCAGNIVVLIVLLLFVVCSYMNSKIHDDHETEIYHTSQSFD